MGYVESNLLPGEQIVQRGMIHWFIFVPGTLFFLIGLSFLGGESPVFGVFLILGAAIALLKALVTYVSTELAVTNKRVIVKVGLISRNTIELNHTKVESFNVNQSVLGRMFGFGTVTVNGTGGVRTPIPSISDPLQFRRSAMEQIEAAQRAAPQAQA